MPRKKAMKKLAVLAALAAVVVALGLLSNGKAALAQPPTPTPTICEATNGEVTNRGRTPPVGRAIWLGTKGDDTIICEGDTPVSVDGRGGNDTITGGNGNDFIIGGNGDNTLDGRDGDDFIIGGKGDDTLAGGNGDDTLDGGGGNDALDGGYGTDTCDGGRGRQTVGDIAVNCETVVNVP